VGRTLLGGGSGIFWKNYYNKIELSDNNSVLHCSCFVDVGDVANVSEVHAVSFRVVVCMVCELLFITVDIRLSGLDDGVEPV
jgi:hypothetical protein